MARIDPKTGTMGKKLPPGMSPDNIARQQAEATAKLGPKNKSLIAVTPHKAAAKKKSGQSGNKSNKKGT